MSRNCHAEKDRIDAAQDYEVNLKAELEIIVVASKAGRPETKAVESTAHGATGPDLNPEAVDGRYTGHLKTVAAEFIHKTSVQGADLMAKINKRDEDSSLINQMHRHISRGQGKSGPNQGNPAKKKMQLSIWYFIVAMLLIFWFQSFMGGPQPETVPYSKFKQWVQDATVGSLLIGPEQITGTLKGEKGKPAKTFVTVRVEDPKLVGQLEQKGIKFSGHIESKWLGALMSWLLPLGIFRFHLVFLS